MAWCAVYNEVSCALWELADSRIQNQRSQKMAKGIVDGPHSCCNSVRVFRRGDSRHKEVTTRHVRLPGMRRTQAAAPWTLMWCVEVIVAS